MTDVDWPIGVVIVDDSGVEHQTELAYDGVRDGVHVFTVLPVDRVALDLDRGFVVRCAVMPPQTALQLALA